MTRKWGVAPFIQTAPMPVQQTYLNIHEHPQSNLYLAVEFLTSLEPEKDFPLEKDKLYNEFVSYCESYTKKQPVTKNIFSMTMKTVLITKGYFVNIKRKQPGNKYLASLQKIRGGSKNRFSSYPHDRVKIYSDQPEQATFESIEQATFESIRSGNFHICDFDQTDGGYLKEPIRVRSVKEPTLC